MRGDCLKIAQVVRTDEGPITSQIAVTVGT